MSRPFLICALLASLAASSARADPISVSLVTDDNHFPYAYLDQGKPAGLYVKIVETIAARMPAYAVRITALPWNRALHQTETGEASGIFPPHRFPAMRPYLDLYSDPIMAETPVLQCNDVALAAHGIDRRRAVWPAGYAGAAIATAMGTHMGGEELRKIFADNRITVASTGGIIENLRTLAHGRVDCVLNDRLTIRAATAWLVKNDPRLQMSMINEAIAFPVEQSHLALSGPAGAREPFHPAFLADFNAQLRRLREDGALDQIVEDYLRQLNS